MTNHGSNTAPRELPTTLLERVTYLQELLIRHATGSREDDTLYRGLRREIIRRPEISHLVPSFVKDCRTISGFWDWIKTQSGQWEPRRAIIREAFAELLDRLEAGGDDPADVEITRALSHFDEDGVRAAWTKALERKRDDPQGAITAARTLLETVCKRILEDAGQSYEDGAELPKLYGLAAATLKLAPDEHTEKAFKSILGSCQNVVNTLGTIRNRLGDAHGQGRMKARPLPRHAALAVNLAGSTALFLVETHAARREQQQREQQLKDPRFTAELLSRLATSDVIGKHVRLKKAGREWRGLSPFTKESTPSFYVNDTKGFFHCFSTGKHGTALDFMIEVQGLSYIEALSTLSEQAAFSIEEWLESNRTE